MIFNNCSIEAHKTLSSGLLASTYQPCLAHELGINQIEFKIEYLLPVKYKGIHLDGGYRLNFLVEDKIVMELKFAEQLKGIHEAQPLTYETGEYQTGFPNQL